MGSVMRFYKKTKSMDIEGQAKKVSPWAYFSIYFHGSKCVLRQFFSIFSKMRIN